MKKIAIVLSGCGFLDGAEITESVSTLIALDQKGCEYTVFAPNTKLSTVNHQTQDSESERNVLAEAARISRGNVHDITDLNPDNFDGIAFPGGFGVAKNLCDWASKGSQCDVNTAVAKTIQSFHSNSKPILAICIAPALIAKVLGEHGVTVTIGNDVETASEIEKTGAKHENCNVDDFITDRLNKVITTPAYMYDTTPAKVFKGITLAVNEFFEMA